MGADWTLYEKLLCNGSGSNKRETAIGESVNAFMSGMVDDPAYQENAVVNGKTTPMVISRKSTIVSAVKAGPGTDIHIGDMVDCFDEHWIVVDLYVDKVGIIGGEMWLCNNELRFQNHSADVVSRYCVVDDGAYAKKSSDPDAFIMANTYKVYITVDNETRKLFVDKRLAFGQVYAPDGSIILEVYKIVGMDLKSKNFGAGSHMMVLTVQRDVYDPQSDNVEENICDFVADNKNDVVVSYGQCSISGRDSVRIGTTRKYTMTFYDQNGLEMSPANTEIEWSVVAPDGVEHVASEHECSVTVPLNEKYVGESIVITASDAAGVFGGCEKKVQVVTIG